MKPFYKHDCDSCHYLGSVLVGNIVYDWHFHPGTHPSNRSIVARYSDHGPDYWSMPAEMVLHGSVESAWVGAKPGETFYSGMQLIARAMLAGSPHEPQPVEGPTTTFFTQGENP